MPTEARQARPELPHALDPARGLLMALGGRRAVVFLDYDGTLTPIVSRPEAAVLSEGMRRAIAALARRDPVAVISGRALDDVRARVGLRELCYAGNHGFEIEGPPDSGLTLRMGEEYLPALSATAADLRRLLAGIDGLEIENKGYSLSVHYRRVADGELGRVRSTVESRVTGDPHLRLKSGKKVLEARPNLDWHKGSAIRWLAERLGDRDHVPVFLGDDVTDEDGFQAIAGHGIGVLVSEEPRPTAARYWLRDSTEVQQLLEHLSSPDAARRNPGS